jgi:hypothetical protein
VDRINLGPYTKAFVALLAAIATAVATGVGNGELDDLDLGQWIGVGLVILGGGAITWFVENVPGVAGGIIKATIGGVTAFLTALQVGYQNDHVISQGEWLTAVGALFVALSAVYQLRNVPPSGA